MRALAACLTVILVAVILAFNINPPAREIDQIPQDIIGGIYVPGHQLINVQLTDGRLHIETTSCSARDQPTLPYSCIRASEVRVNGVEAKYTEAIASWRQTLEVPFPEAIKTVSVRYEVLINPKSFFWASWENQDGTLVGPVSGLK